MEDLKQLLKSTTLQKLIQGKQKVVEVPYTATVEQTLNVMRETGVSSVAVASPPADGFHYDRGSVELTDCPTETASACRADDDDDLWSACKHTLAPAQSTNGPRDLRAVAPQLYIGIASTFDILSYFAKLLSKTRDTKVFPQLLLDSPIHRCIRGHTLFMLSPNISVLEAMEKMISGTHRALVPQIIRHDGERTACSGYFMITHTDIIRFFQAESETFRPILARTVESLQAYQSGVLGLWGDISLIDAIRCMHEESLTAVPILEVAENVTSKDITPAEGKILVGTFSASDLKRCHADALSRWAEEGLVSFLKRVIIMENLQRSVDDLEADSNAKYHLDLMGSFLQFDHVNCTLDMSLQDVINMALENKVHRVWVLEKDNVLIGLVSFIDIFRVVSRYASTSQRDVVNVTD